MRGGLSWPDRDEQYPREMTVEKVPQRTIAAAPSMLHDEMQLFKNPKQDGASVRAFPSLSVLSTGVQPLPLTEFLKNSAGARVRSRKTNRSVRLVIGPSVRSSEVNKTLSVSERM